MTLYCEESGCRLRDACAARGLGALVALGPHGTRPCLSPPIPAGSLGPADDAALERAAASAAAAGRARLAILAVPRDDLVDGGASRLVALVRRIRAAMPNAAIELHVGDLGGSLAAWRDLLRLRPALVHHAVAASSRAYAKALPGFDYVRSLELLRVVKEEFEHVHTRATIALGFGETRDELVAAIADLKSVRAEELLFTVAEPPLGKGATNPDALEKALGVARKLGFDRIEVQALARPCAPPGEAAAPKPKKGAGSP